MDQDGRLEERAYVCISGRSNYSCEAIGCKYANMGAFTGKRDTDLGMIPCVRQDHSLLFVNAVYASRQTNVYYMTIMFCV